MAEDGWTLRLVARLVGLMVLALSATVAIFYKTTSMKKRNMANPQLKQHYSGGGTLGSCVWAPNDDSDCITTVSKRILATSVNHVEAPNRSAPLRWLFIGDSTMGKLFGEGGIKQQMLNARSIQDECPWHLMCFHRTASRCELNEAFLLPPLLPASNSSWILPNQTMGEGPCAYGLENPNCQDCKGCNSVFAVCNKRRYVSSNKECNINGPGFTSTTMYGGYFSVEFARDVEIQTPEFKTSQENIAWFIHSHYNSDPWFLNHFGGHPVCVASAGIHDLAVPHNTQQQFVANVEWFLHVLLAPCSHVIWLQNTAPLKKNASQTDLPYPQNQVNMRQWNEAVHYHLNASQTLPKERLTIIDPFDASIDYPHNDNVHLITEWYKALGMLFWLIMEAVTREGCKT